MNLHNHARLTPRGRALLVGRVVDEGLRRYDPWIAGPDACPAGTVIVRASPARFADADPGEVPLLFLSPGPGLERHAIEDPHRHALRMAIYRQVDLQLLAPLVGSGRAWSARPGGSAALPRAALSR